MVEVWKEISNYEELYAISNFGRIKSLKKDKILKNFNHKRGYLHITLSKNGKGINYTVHKLVGLHFISNPDNLPQIDHIDRVKHNNTVVNLRWVNNSTNQFNTEDRKNKISNYRNVYLDKRCTIKKWRAILQIDGKPYHLGRFETQELANKEILKFKKQTKWQN